MADHALGRAAAQRIKDAVVPRRRHGDGVDIEFDGGVYDRFHDVAGSKDHRQQGARRRNTQPRRRLADVKEVHGDVRAGQKATKALNSCDCATRRWREIDRNQYALELYVAADLIDETARARSNEERRNTPSATEPCSQCATPSRPWVASTTRSLPCSLRKSTMACVGSCNLMRMLSTSIPSLLAIVHGGSSSWESPHCASRRCACGNAKASLASYWDTCRRCNLLRAAKAMRNAWAKAAALRSEKSVGCTMERMAFIAIAHTRTRDHKSMPRAVVIVSLPRRHQAASAAR